MQSFMLQEFTGGHDNLPDKVKALDAHQAPDMYKKILNM